MFDSTDDAPYQIGPADLADVCQWGSIVWASREAYERGQRMHAAYHERREMAATVVMAVLKRATVVGWGGLTDREREIARAYSAGADL